ncbi:2-dehydropantoate 2-reductase [Candidatus Lokiarchaeum ossiferum]|uniref:2-dehydropantoate 2-reductase n=1 Tax=Candidatus Lokiarchaeum ossiferum TaxID=2951803 RepID=A0ABY6HV75_9ARCH|nr:2-dehydropantoate 2-reductase [Candidatus Lokiarchaeum sp. B-35]
MKFLIIGAGSIGSFFGAKLALSGNQVLVYTDKKTSNYLLKHKLKLQDIGKTIHEVENFALASPLEKLLKVDESNLPNLCIISAKSYDLDSICIVYKPLLSKMKSLVLLQNGLGNEEVVYTHYPNMHIYRLITSNGAYLSSNGTVEHRGAGKTFLSPWYPNSTDEAHSIAKEMKNFVDALNSAGIPTTIATNSHAEIWKKAFINIGINAIGALTGLANGSIIQVNELTQYCEMAVQEAINVAKLLGVQLQNENYYLQDVYNVIHATSANKNSMLQDFIRRNPTEIEFLNGKIVILGKKLGVPTPINGLLTALIKGKEFSQK